MTTMHGLHSVNRYSRIMTRGERVIAVSETVRAHILQHYPDCPDARIEVIPRGIDPEAFPRDHQPSVEWLQHWATTYPSLAGKRLIVMPGRISSLKGHDVFIRLVGALVTVMPDVHGLVVGEAESGKETWMKTLQARIEEHGLASQFTFTGYRSDMRDIYSRASLVLSLTRKPEAFGRTVLEALSQGIPVIGWGCGGVGEILQSLFPQGWISPGDEIALFERCRELLEAPREPLVNQRYLLSDMQARTLDVYHRVMEANG